MADLTPTAQGNVQEGKNLAMKALSVYASPRFNWDGLKNLEYGLNIKYSNNT